MLAGNSLLTLAFEPVSNGSEISISEKIFGDAVGNELVVSGPITGIIPGCANIDDDAFCDIVDTWPTCEDDGTDPYDECGVCNGEGIASGECDCDGNVLDCNGLCGGDGVLDNCGTCDNDFTNNCIPDCNGVWGGDAVYDNCFTCDNDSSNDCIEDCFGVWGGDAYVDNCGLCDDDPSNDCIQDCAGTWGGILEIDECGICGGVNYADTCIDTNDCIDLVDGSAFGMDCFGNCGLSGGLARLDDCGVCGGMNYAENCQGVNNWNEDQCTICLLYTSDADDE